MLQELHPAARKTLQILAIALCILTVVTVAAHFVTRGLEAENPAVQMFNMLDEANFPTWYASILWLFVSLAAVTCYVGERFNPDASPKFRWMWLVIAAAFFVASADEVATIHEAIGSFAQFASRQSVVGQTLHPVQQAQDAPDSPWIIYYAPFLIAFGLAAGAFLLQRFRKFKLFLISCFLAADCYAVAIACDHYQGLAHDKQAAIAEGFHVEWHQLLDFSLVFEETIEDIGTALIVLAFTGYGAHQICLALAAERIAKAKPPTTPVE